MSTPLQSFNKSKRSWSGTNHSTGKKSKPIKKFLRAYVGADGSPKEDSRTRVRLLSASHQSWGTSFQRAVRLLSPEARASPVAASFKSCYRNRLGNRHFGFRMRVSPRHFRWTLTTIHQPTLLPDAPKPRFVRLRYPTSAHPWQNPFRWGGESLISGREDFKSEVRDEAEHRPDTNDARRQSRQTWRPATDDRRERPWADIGWSRAGGTDQERHRPRWSVSRQRWASTSSMTGSFRNRAGHPISAPPDERVGAARTAQRARPDLGTRGGAIPELVFRNDFSGWVLRTLSSHRLRAPGRLCRLW